jgi:hypothetical protein
MVTVSQTIQLRGSNGPRPIRFVDLFEHAGWRMKLYSVAHDRPVARQELIQAARRIATDILPQPAISSSRYGVGFIGAHDGCGSAFAFVDWWEGENELQHHAFATDDVNSLTDLRNVSSKGRSVCVWDLRVQWFEREAWVKHVLRNPRGPDIEGYLNERFDGHA